MGSFGGEGGRFFRVLEVRLSHLERKRVKMMNGRSKNRECVRSSCNMVSSLIKPRPSYVDFVYYSLHLFSCGICYLRDCIFFIHDRSRLQFHELIKTKKTKKKKEKESLTKFSEFVPSARSLRMVALIIRVMTNPLSVLRDSSNNLIIHH